MLNEPLVRVLGLSPKEIELLAEPVQEELQARKRIFREKHPWQDLAGKTAVLVDDGLASGYTILSALRVICRRKPFQIVVAVPTASESTINLLAPLVDTIVCPNIRSVYSSAVADAYRNWYDLEQI